MEKSSDPIDCAPSINHYQNLLGNCQIKILQLENSLNQQSKFNARMIHELRTPLNAIMGFLELLVDGKLGSLNHEQADILTTVYKSAQYMLQLINSVLDLAKIEHGEIILDITSFSLPELVHEVFYMFEPLVHKKHLQLKFDAEEISLIIADRQRLKQVLINLVGNALKFTEQGFITIHAKEDMQNIYIIVRDTGIGIPEDKQAQLFQPFTRIENGKKHSEDQIEGSGLGLYISKIIVGLHGGKIEIQSTWQKGTQFTVIIPTIL